MKAPYWLLDKPSESKDIWFQTEASLEEVVAILGLKKPECDGENRWEWCIGRLGGRDIDVTRDHREPRAETDLRIFCLDLGAFGQKLLEHIIAKVEPIALGPIEHGKWVDPRERR